MEIFEALHKAEGACGAESASMVHGMLANCAVETLGKEYPISSPTAHSSWKPELYLTIDFDCFSESAWSAVSVYPFPPQTCSIMQHKEGKFLVFASAD